MNIVKFAERFDFLVCKCAPLLHAIRRTAVEEQNVCLASTILKLAFEYFPVEFPLPIIKSHRHARLFIRHSYKGFPLYHRLPLVFVQMLGGLKVTLDALLFRAFCVLGYRHGSVTRNQNDR